MNDTHGGSLENPGAIRLTTSPRRQALALEVHYVTVHLSSTEALELLSRIIKLGVYLWGVDWFIAVYTHLGLQPRPKED